MPKSRQTKQWKPRTSASTNIGPEIMIGVVGPVGVDLRHVAQVFREVLSSVHYSCEEIRLSNGCTLHTTTFPCHDCAKHIVAAGISRVVYVEPYPKSLAAELYPDSVAVEGKGDPARQVPFDPFVGIAPRKYIELFTMVDRKDDKGKAINWDRTTEVPKSLAYPLSFYPMRKAFYYDEFQNAMTKVGLNS